MSSLPCSLVLLEVCGLSHLRNPSTISTAQRAFNAPHYHNSQCPRPFIINYKVEKYKGAAEVAGLGP